MVVESFINPLQAEKKPWWMFFLGAFYAILGSLLAMWVYIEYSSMLMVFFTVLATIPLIFNTMKVEESKDLKINSERKILKEHSKAILFLIILFLGITIAFALLYIFLPAKQSQLLFLSQTNTINQINNNIVGRSISMTIFPKIILNNIKVFTFCILFSFIYGAGAIFILTWNASVIAAAIGNFFRTKISSYAAHVGMQKTAAYFNVFSISFLKYLLHGLPEILAYFIGGLAGGIMSVSIMKREFGTKRFEKILIDSSGLVIIALALLFVAALIEVFITPLLF